MQNKQDRVYDILWANPGKRMTILDINIALHDIITEDYWLKDVIHAAVYRNTIKHNDIEIIKVRKGYFLYRFNEVPVEGKTIDDAADKALVSVTSHTAPAETVEEPDLFSIDEDYVFPEVYPLDKHCSHIDDDKDICLCESTLPISHDEVNKMCDFAPNMPDVTVTALRHLIQAYHPITVTGKIVMEHFGCNAERVFELFLEVGKRNDIQVTADFKAFVL